jgi:hypothetical protein
VDEVDGGVLLLLVTVALAGAAVTHAGHRRRVRERTSLERLLAREPTLVRTDVPCGLGAGALSALASIPAGARRRGVEHGVAGPLRLVVDGRPATLECAAFRWWWEEERTEGGGNGARTSYVRKRTTVALVRLPTPVEQHVLLRPETVLGRAGLTRGGHQVESSEFNRRFRVECRDRTLTLHLLDAGMQQLLASHYPGRSIEVLGDLLALVGPPTHRDTSLAGAIGELPAVRQDAARLLAAVPPSFWRAVGAPSP